MLVLSVGMRKAVGKAGYLNIKWNFRLRNDENSKIQKLKPGDSQVFLNAMQCHDPVKCGLC